MTLAPALREKRGFHGRAPFRAKRSLRGYDPTRTGPAGARSLGDGWTSIFDAVCDGRVWSGGRAARLRAPLIALVLVLVLPLLRCATGRRAAVEGADLGWSGIAELLW